MGDRLMNISGGRWSENNYWCEMSICERKYYSRREDA